MRATLVSKDGLDPIQVQRRTGPVDQCLEDFLHLAAGAEFPLSIFLSKRIRSLGDSTGPG
jgi:hypothetical protein